MRITYAGVDLIAGDDVLDTVGGELLPTGQQETQVVPYPRRFWARIFPRGNRTQALRFRVTPPPFAVPGAALVDLSRYFAELPEEGALVIDGEDGAILQWANAVLQDFAPARARIGVSTEYILTFLCTDFSVISEADESGGGEPAIEQWTWGNGEGVQWANGGYLTLPA